MDIKKVSVASFDVGLGPKSTSDSKYWNSFNFPVTVKEYGPVTDIAFAPTDSRTFAVSTSNKVQIYDTVTSQVGKTLSKFHDTAYGGSFRRDGKLLVAGCEDGKVRVYDIASKTQLRILHGHLAPVHASKFTSDNLHVVSFSNDKNVIVWDMPGEVSLHTFKEHKDYVHSGAVNNSSSNIFISGSYDHTVKMWDSRTTASVLTVDHGAPVESVLMFPSGGAFISSGGSEVKIWDAIGGGRLIAKLSQHHKTVTCLAFASHNTRLLSGSLDRHVKVYDTNNYKVVHTLNFPSPILSVGISDNDSTLAVGMTDGLLSIQNRTEILNKELSEDKYKLKHAPFQRVEGAMFVKHQQYEKSTKHDTFLQHFEVTKALDYVLRTHMINKPEIAMAVIQDLIRKGSIKAAVAEKQDLQLALLLRFILKHMTNPAFSRLMVDFVNIVLDVYAESVASTPIAANLLKKIVGKLNREVDCMKEMMATNGAIELLLAASNAGQSLEATNGGPDEVLLAASNAGQSLEATNGASDEVLTPAVNAMITS